MDLFFLEGVSIFDPKRSISLIVETHTVSQGEQGRGLFALMIAEYHIWIPLSFFLSQALYLFLIMIQTVII